MGALAPISSWIPEDDVLLKNAVEAGASLESLAKGAVRFSRRFTIRELQDRWYSLLYDPVVSAEASMHMIEYEPSASSLPSKPNRFGNLNETKCVSGKRKAESVRKCYYSMRKRICNEPFNSMDLTFLIAPSQNNCIEYGDEPPANCTIENTFSNHFELQELNLDVMEQEFPQIVMDGAAAGSPSGAACKFPAELHEESFPVDQNNIHTEVPLILGENLQLTSDHSRVVELRQPNELPVTNLFESEDLEAQSLCTFDRNNSDLGNICSEFGGSQVFNSPISDCGTQYHDLDYSSPLDGMPIWKTIEGASFGEKNQLIGDTFALHNNDDVKNTSLPLYDVAFPDSTMKNQLLCDEPKSSPASPDDYLAELSNSLLNFTNEEELLFMDADGKDVIDRSYYDGLSSLLLSFPHDNNKVDIPSTIEPEVSEAPDAYLAVPDGACPGEHDNNGRSHCDEAVCNSEVQMSSSASSVNPEFPELVDGVICCSLNTEELEAPCNDDIFLPNQVPSFTFYYFQDGLYSQITSEQDPNRINTGQSHLSSQMIESQLLLDTDPNNPRGGSGVNLGLPKNELPHLASRSAGISCGDPSQISSVNPSANGFISGKLRAEPLEAQMAKHHSNNISNSFRNIRTDAGCSHHEIDALNTTQNQELHEELWSIDMAAPEQVLNTLTPDLEEAFESDEDIPYFSDIEAMILDMDLGPNDHDLYFIRGVSRYQREETKRTIVRLEQGAYSYMQRAIASHGAFAILYGRHTKHYIKKCEVLLGRATEDVSVDIDLGREGHANKISRRQATIKMDKCGSFYLTNLGKCSILINDKELVSGQTSRLNSGCLLEIRGMPLIFETSQTCVKQYLKNMSGG